MSWTDAMKCFWCSNPINARGRHVYAVIQHEYKNGETRDTDRRFHVPCFEKFESEEGRPWNPGTHYVVLQAEVVEPEVAKA